MDTQIKDGDFVLDGRGRPVVVTGLKEILQQIMIRLTVKKGSFVYNPNLGSDLYKLYQYSSDLESQAFLMVHEAISDMEDVFLENVTITQDDNDSITNLNVTVSINSNKEELEVSL